MKALLPRVRPGGALPGRSRPALPALVVRVACVLVALLALLDVSVSRAAQPVANTGFPQTFTDRLGRKVTVRKLPQRIVSITPSNTELAYAVGAGDRLVGVTTFCNYPPEATKLPKIGGFAARTISIESIVAARPDLVLAGDQSQRMVIDALERAGLTVASVQPRGFEGILETVDLIGRLTGHGEEARRINDDARQRMRHVSERLATIPPEKRVRVYWEVFDQPLMTAGPKSLVGQIIELGGGNNVFGDVAEDYPQISTEAVIARNPQVIMGPTSMRTRALTREALHARPGWERIAAVRELRIVVLPDELVARAAPRFVDGVELVARMLYPALFADPPAKVKDAVAHDDRR